MKASKILVLGGNGFIGQQICQTALSQGIEVVSVSRSGRPKHQEPWVEKVDWRKGDLLDQDVVRTILDEGGFQGVVHTVGILFDWNSPVRGLNRIMSGSKNVAQSERDTYEQVIEQTARNSLQAFEEALKKKNDLRFVFISAAETQWENTRLGRIFEKAFMPRFLKQYLQHKRAINRATNLMPNVSVVYPSIVYRWSQWGKIPVVLGFRAFCWLPIVKNPVHVERLSKEILALLLSE